jgi:DHA1 family inner membrane transport protein
MPVSRAGLSKKGTADDGSFRFERFDPPVPEREVVSDAGPVDRRRTHLFGSLCTVVFLVNMGRIVFAPMLEPLREAFSVTSAGAVGLVATLAWLGSALPRLPTGYLLTKVPRHHVVLGAGAVLTGASVLTATAGSLPALYVGALAMGLASGAYFIAANPLVSELYPEGVGRAIGIHGTASQLAAVAAPLFVSGVLLVGTWRLAFWAIAGATALATAVLFVIARRATLPEAGASDRNLLVALRHQWPLIVTGVGIIGATGFVWNGVFNFYVSYLIDAKGLAPGGARTMLTVVFAAGVPAFWVTGRLADRVPVVPLMLSILGGFVVCLLAVTAVSSFGGVLVASAVVGYVIHSLFPALDTYMLGTLPDEHRGSAYAIYSGTMMLVQATGSVVVGTLRDMGFAYDLVFRSFAVGLVAVLAVLVVLHRAGWLPSGE